MIFIVRDAKIDDFESIAWLSFKLGYVATNNQIKKRLTDIIKNEDNRLLVAIENGKVIGWIHGFYTQRIESSPFIEIGGLVVDENYQRMGVGKLLVEEINKWAILKKCEKLRVRCNKIRKGAHAFYQNINFKINKEQIIFDKNLK